ADEKTPPDLAVYFHGTRWVKVAFRDGHPIDLYTQRRLLGASMGFRGCRLPFIGRRFIKTARCTLERG
ncbi:MAG: hypothetical protein AAGE99_05225, partial [Chlamydiota bacterium]